eukprot:6194324-Pleurochrysis_carterae.AAC.3
MSVPSSHLMLRVARGSILKLLGSWSALSLASSPVRRFLSLAYCVCRRADGHPDADPVGRSHRAGLPAAQSPLAHGPGAPLTEETELVFQI